MARTPTKQPSFAMHRVRLRPFRKADLKTLHALYGDAENLRYWSVPAIPDIAHTRRALLRHLFDDLGVHKVEALIRPENKPSAALAKRLGFRLEGGPIRDRWQVD